MPATLVRARYLVGDARAVLMTSGVLAVNPGDVVNMLGRISDAGGGASIAGEEFEYSAGLLVPSLSYAEIPSW